MSKRARTHTLENPTIGAFQTEAALPFLVTIMRFHDPKYRQGVDLLAFY
jgi:hypothetical protein